MRILHIVTNADLGGAPRVVTELANRAVRDGHVCAAATVPDGLFWDQLDPRVERFPLRHLRRNLDPGQDFAALLEFVALFKRWKPNIVHVHSSKAGVLGRSAALLASCGVGRRILTVYTIHGFDTILKTHRRFLPLERIMAHITSAIVPVSAYDEANLRKTGIRGTIRLIHNGVSDRLMQAANPVAAARIEAARARGDVIVLSVARLEPPKRFDLFLEVARSFVDADPRSGAEAPRTTNMPHTVPTAPGAQNGPRAPNMLNVPNEPPPAKVAFFWIGNVQNVDSATLPPNVEMLGEVPEAGNCVNLCDIFLLLSDYEGLPMSVLEALSCGRPVVASDVGGIREAVGGTDEPDGVLVPNDAKVIADAIANLAGNAELRARLGASARRRYERGFSADAMWRDYLRLYEELRGGSTRA